MCFGTKTIRLSPRPLPEGSVSPQSSFSPKTESSWLSEESQTASCKVEMDYTEPLCWSRNTFSFCSWCQRLRGLRATDGFSKVKLSGESSAGSPQLLCCKWTSRGARGTLPRSTWQTPVALLLRLLPWKPQEEAGCCCCYPYLVLLLTCTPSADIHSFLSLFI